MFCNIKEAYNTPLKQQLENLDKINNIRTQRDALNNSVKTYQKKHGLIPPHQTGSCPDPDIAIMTNNQNIHSYTDQPYFSAQGDMKQNLCGTTLDDLKKYEDDDSSDNFSDNFSDKDTISFSPTLGINTLPSIDSNDNKPKKNIIHSHEYYIYSFIRELKKNDLSSLMGSELDEVYDHVKTCKFCKKQINNEITKSNNSKLVEKKDDNVIKIEKQQTDEIKEIVIIIIICIIVIIVLDLFYKIYKALDKK